MTDQAIEVRKAHGNVRWIVAWSTVAALLVIGLLGAFTIGALVLPVAGIAALAVAVLRARAARATAPPGPGPSFPGCASISSTGVHVSTSNPLTTIALALSLASILVAPLAFAGLITGVIALREIRESGAAQAGSGRAVAAIVIGAVIAVAYVTLMVTVVLPR